MPAPLFDSPAPGDILGAMITPAVLISASGALTLSTTHRLGRIVDRLRALHAQAEVLPPWDATDHDMIEKRALIADQIAWQTRRIGVLQAAIITLYIAIELLVGASLAIGLSAVGRGMLEWVPVGLGMAGAASPADRRVVVDPGSPVRGPLDAGRDGLCEADGRPADREAAPPPGTGAAEAGTGPGTRGRGHGRPAGPGRQTRIVTGGP